MHALMIDGESRSIVSVDVSCLADIAKLVGQDSIISDDIDQKDAVYFDEDCFIRGTTGRFQIDKLPPIAGKAVAVGHVQGEQLSNVSLSLEELKNRTAFL